MPDGDKAGLLACVQTVSALNGSADAGEAALSWASQALLPVSDTSPRALTLHLSVMRAHASVQPACESGLTLSETMQAATSTLAFDLDLLLAGMPKYGELEVQPSINAAVFALHASVVLGGRELDGWPDLTTCFLAPCSKPAAYCLSVFARCASSHRREHKSATEAALLADRAPDRCGLGNQGRDLHTGSRGDGSRLECSHSSDLAGAWRHSRDI